MPAWGTGTISRIAWLVVALAGALALAVLASSRGEPVGATWMLVATASVLMIGYRFYGRFLARRVVKLDPSRATPAVRLEDGLDFVPTNRTVLFGHHFAAIAGAGPLVGPVLAAQMGYLPSILWILVGVVLGGAVQDFVILFISMRRDARSLGELIRLELGVVPGAIALFGTFAIMVIILAVLALIVVRALSASPWGAFTVAATVPIALLMGAYSRWLRPGRVGEISLLGVVALMAALVGGQAVAASPVLAPYFTLTPVQLCWILIGYGAVASILPVWLLLAPRDYLSTFLKIGAILALALGILVVAPELRMPPVTRFIDGSGPVWSGPLFPFLFITIACGAVSGFHALISSGTTPRLIASESDALFIGYGAMLMEGLVAVMALVGASILDPGLYFAMNSPAAVLGTDAASAAAAVTHMGFPIAPETLTDAAKAVGESTIISRTGGAPTLAVAMADIFSKAIGGNALRAFWYHFAILFEALFILTAVDAGTRAGRFMLQDLIGLVVPRFKSSTGIWPGVISTVLCVFAWGYFLYQGVTDPLGGVNTLWPVFGISNQMLASIALMLATVVLVRMKRERYAWVVAIPGSLLVILTSTAGLMKLFSADPKISFLSHASKFAEALGSQQVLAPAKSLAEMRQIVLNDRVDAAVCAVFLLVVWSVTVFAAMRVRSALTTPRRTDAETPYVALA